jgi:hypothetical protein
MGNELLEHYEVSMHYAGELFAHWQGSPYRLAHQPQIFAGVIDPAVCDYILTHGLDPLFIGPLHSEDDSVKRPTAASIGSW